jgi:hypothetical protein
MKHANRLKMRPMPTAISIEEAVKACILAGNGMVPGKAPVLSALKQECSLVGLAYLNTIYQNDIANQHFCEAMLLMYAQVPAGTANPYLALFEPENAVATMAALADVQLAFDYAIARTDPPEAKVEASIASLRRSPANRGRLPSQVTSPASRGAQRLAGSAGAASPASAGLTMTLATPSPSMPI